MSDDATARLGLPYLAAGQMQKHVTLNEALTRLDALVQAGVVSRTVAAQPVDPEDGALYILPAGATGAAWDDRPEGSLMRAEAGGWTPVETPDGMVVLVRDAGLLLVRDQGAWVEAGRRLGAVQGLGRIGLGAEADAANPFLAKLNAALWTALDAASGGDGDLRLKLNKERPADVLSLLFQSGFGGRAEMGLVGDDDFRLKVSADGGGWNDALSIDRATGRAWFPLGAARREVTVFEAGGSYVVPGWARMVEAVAVGGGGGGGGGAFGASGARFGGAGGGAGGVSVAGWPAEQIAAGLTVAVGGGGSGGVAGAAGGATTLHCGASLILTGAGGGGGALGGASAGAGGSGGAGAPRANDGGESVLASAAGPGAALDRPDGAGGGGGGGALDAAGNPRAGGPGGDGGVLTVLTPGGSGGSGAGGDGGWDAGWPQLSWAGGGGGGGGANVSGAGHGGGTGGDRGAGGGGGGAGVTAGGQGGDGAPGVVWLIAQG